MEGHTQELYDCDFNQNGVHVSTASADNTIKIWDLRQTGEAIKTLPAHQGLVTRCVFQKNCAPASNFMVSASYDKNVKIWSAPGYVQLRGVKTTGKVMGLDVSHNSKWMAASCYDKTIKLWDLDAADKEKVKTEAMDTNDSTNDSTIESTIESTTAFTKSDSTKTESIEKGSSEMIA
jgi:WD40 repeat protein